MFCFNGMIINTFQEKGINKNTKFCTAIPPNFLAAEFLQLPAATAEPGTVSC